MRCERGPDIVQVTAGYLDLNPVRAGWRLVLRTIGGVVGERFWERTGV